MVIYFSSLVEWGRDILWILYKSTYKFFLVSSSILVEISMVVVDGEWDSRVHFSRMKSSEHISSMMDSLPVVLAPSENGETENITS